MQLIQNCKSLDLESVRCPKGMVDDKKGLEGRNH